MTDPLEIYLVATPGLEDVLCAEAQAAGFASAQVTQGGVTLTGGWDDVWRANLTLRGATRVLVRLGTFMAFHLAQLDKRARRFPFADTLRADVPVRVEVTSRASKIYHAGAAQERIERALTEAHGLTLAPDAPVVLKVRIDDNRVTISLDTSGESLHKRGHKEAVNKAPLRETLAALLLRACGYDGSEPLVDPMCGSGTIPIEAAEIACGLLPGRDRSFAFEHLATFDPARLSILRRSAPRETDVRIYGYDRDQGAIAMSQANAARAGVADLCTFACQPISDLACPAGPPGLVLINPPYGGRIGDKRALYPLYATMGQVLMDRFSGWRVGFVTTEAGLAKATGLPLQPPGPVIANGGLKIRLWQTATLP